MFTERLMLVAVWAFIIIVPIIVIGLWGFWFFVACLILSIFWN